VQEARYQFSGYVQIADAPVIRHLEMPSRSAKLASHTSKVRTPERKGLTVNISVLRLAAAEMQQMFHSTT
jgi:hypothetical protein